MIALLQRVQQASVTVEDSEVASIQGGLCILLGVCPEDTEEDGAALAKKIAGLRIFEDEEGKMNRSIVESGGAALVVSQFTLYADCRKGRRPSFTGAAAPDLANELYERFAKQLEELGLPVQTGRFGAHMQVHIQNDGPVTIWLDSKQLSRDK